MGHADVRLTSVSSYVIISKRKRIVFALRFIGASERCHTTILNGNRKQGPGMRVFGLYIYVWLSP